MVQSFEITAATRLFLTIAFGLIISVAWTRTSGFATAIRFDELPEDQKAAALSLLNDAMLETDADPIKLIKLGLDKAKENDNKPLSEEHEFPDTFLQASAHGGSAPAVEQTTSTEAPMSNHFDVEHDESVLRSELEDIPTSEQSISQKAGDLDREVEHKPELAKLSEVILPEQQPSFSTPSKIPDSSDSEQPSEDEQDDMETSASETSSAVSSSAHFSEEEQHESQSSEPMHHHEHHEEIYVANEAGLGPMDHEHHEEIHLKNEASSSSLDHEHHEEVHTTSEVSSDPTHHEHHEEVHVTNEASSDPSPHEYHEEVHVSSDADPNGAHEHHHEEMHMSHESNPDSTSQKSHEYTNPIPSELNLGKESHPGKEESLPKEEVFEDKFIDNSDPKNPKKVHIKEKNKTEVHPDGYSHEHHKSQTTTSLNNPNNFRHQESSSSSFSGNSYKKKNRNNWSYKQRRPYPVIPAMPMMPQMPAMPPMAMMPYALHPAAASAWTGLYGSNYGNPLGFASSGAYASAYAGIPNNYYSGYRNYGGQSKRSAKRRRRNEARRARNQQQFNRYRAQ